MHAMISPIHFKNLGWLGRSTPVRLVGSPRPKLQRSQPYPRVDRQDRSVPAQSTLRQKEPSLLVKPSPTSTLPKLVSAMTFAAVEAGISISTPFKPASTFASASRESVPPKSGSYPAAPPERRISE